MTHLWLYNNVKRPLWNVWFRWRYMPEWLAEGRDPNLFPVAGRIDQKTYEWAKRQKCG